MWIGDKNLKPTAGGKVELQQEPKKAKDKLEIIRSIERTFKQFTFERKRNREIYRYLP